MKECNDIRAYPPLCACARSCVLCAMYVCARQWPMAPPHGSAHLWQFFVILDSLSTVCPSPCPGMSNLHYHHGQLPCSA